ncbi:ABC-type antimicrobial peptide transport system, ATPase component [hydrothermal vent metagenome]|uniref:ABC-type antimicrobial peptide transport system, ATPase component n=1 Tax=hydrothermal vent metagenome TaxID=652676 RepID=A0A3B0RCJ3_9ZZZZ
MNTNSEIIKLDKISKDYRLGKTIVTALKDVSITVHKGEFLAIVGPSGSGKSTTLNIIGCLEEPSSGSVTIDGENLTGLSSNELADIRAAKMGFIFQTFNLLPVLNIFENVEYPLHLRGIGKAERHERVTKVIEEVGLKQFTKHKPSELSGGQRQRVAIARALVGSPDVILADEPTANLDRQTGEEILTQMKELNKRLGVTFIFSTHDQKIMDKAQRIVELRDGELVK